MSNEILFSIIVPQRNAISMLPHLMASIPDRDDIEIIIVDNTPTPITRDEIGVDKNYKLLWSAPERHAGGARNVGIENAQGQWLIFADADDYFTANAFDVFDSFVNSKADIVYFKAEGVYLDTGRHSTRADLYSKLVDEYCSDKATEMNMRLNYCVPWAKMLNSKFVREGRFRYDEIRAGNDIYFSTITGFYANNVEAADAVVYNVTVTCGSLTKRKDYEVIKARLFSKLHCNQFLREHGLSDYQNSVMFAFKEARNYGIKAYIEFCGMVIKYHQNPFVNCKNWFKTMKYNIKHHDDDKYIVR